MFLDLSGDIHFHIFILIFLYTGDIHFHIFILIYRVNNKDETSETTVQYSFRCFHKGLLTHLLSLLNNFGQLRKIGLNAENQVDPSESQN